ncbi:serine acetyltransferase [Ruminococcus sp.]|uniref:serine acetyltransferase n=1 Tax=Ruminococcus sp. TaxID=41978 RepID=UPI00307C1B44
MNYLMPNIKSYQKKIAIDYKFNAAFRNGILSKQFLKSFEWKFIKCYRKCQCNPHGLWNKIYRWRLNCLEKKTGFSFENNMSIGNGLIIGHKGTIVINSQAKFGSLLFITHGVTIGRDIRGKRAGAPSFGDRVCIRTNSTVVGNIKIGNDVLIAPNTFVNFDVPDHSIVIGNPASIHHRDNATEGHIPKI